MSCSVKPVCKSLSPTPNGCLLTLPAIFTTTKTSSYQDLSKPIKINLSISHYKPPILLFSTNSSRTQSSSAVSASEDDEVGVKLYVWNLEKGIDSAKLAELFQQAGFVEISEVVYFRETGESRGFGFVNMSTVEEADKAIKMFHRFNLNGRLLTVEKSTPRGSLPGTWDHRVFVSNLPLDVDEERLEQLLSEHGKVVHARIIVDRYNLRSRGMGFVAMSTEAEMNDAVANLNGKVEKAISRGSSVGPDLTHRVFVANLPYDVDEERLEQLFSKYGKVVHVKIVVNRDTLRSIGKGFVAMSTEAEMNDAVANLNGKSLGGRLIKVKIAKEKPTRSLRLEANPNVWRSS